MDILELITFPIPIPGPMQAQPLPQAGGGWWMIKLSLTLIFFIWLKPLIKIPSRNIYSLVLGKNFKVLPSMITFSTKSFSGSKMYIAKGAKSSPKEIMNWLSLILLSFAYNRTCVFSSINVLSFKIISCKLGLVIVPA